MSNPTPSENISSFPDFESLKGILDAFYGSKIVMVAQIIIGIYCLILLFNIVFLTRKLSLFKEGTRRLIKGTATQTQTYETIEALPGSMRLPEVHRKIASESPSDWKIAIIEADKIFDKHLEAKGFHGVSLGDKLKDMVPADLPDVYEEVWEAHKIRNRIVHEPDFEVTQSEASKLIGIYERALKKIK